MFCGGKLHSITSHLNDHRRFNFYRQAATVVVNSLYLDLIRHNIGPDLDPKAIAFDQEIPQSRTIDHPRGTTSTVTQQQ